MPERVPTGPLVDADALARRRSEPGTRVIDCRFVLGDADAGRRAHAAGTIPGAAFADLETDLCGPIVAGRTGRHPLPAPEAFAATAGRLGIGPHDLVVAFDDAGGSFASRLWWMLRWIGHDRAAVLDGGISAWTAAGYALARPAAPVPGPALPVRLRPELSVDAPDVERARADPGVVLLDARAPDRFAGRNETIDPVAGRIPGARNAFWRDNLGPDGRVLAPEALRSHLAARLGAADPGRAICYCGSGVTACHDVLAFAVAGLPLPRLYAGSWSHWITDPARPIERG